MVEMQKGEIFAHSNPGEGSVFTITYRECLLGEVPAVEERPQAVRQSSSGGNHSILVVEDNAVNRKLARNVLRSRGYKVLEAASGEEALKLLERTRADLILMDIQLPGMDGLEVVRRLKQDPATADIPVVALTAHAHEQDEIRAMEAGCAGYIAKPIRLALFPEQIESYLFAERQTRCLA